MKSEEINEIGILKERINELEAFKETTTKYLDYVAEEFNKRYEISSGKSYININRIKDSIIEFKSYSDSKKQLKIEFDECVKKD
jgi:hypothetical protein